MQRPLCFTQPKTSVFTRSVVFLAAVLAVGAATSYEASQPGHIRLTAQHGLERTETEHMYFTKTKTLLEQSERTHQLYVVTIHEVFERLERTQIDISRNVKELNRRLDAKLEQESAKP